MDTPSIERALDALDKLTGEHPTGAQSAWQGIIYDVLITVKNAGEPVGYAAPRRLVALAEGKAGYIGLYPNKDVITAIPLYTHPAPQSPQAEWTDDKLRLLVDLVASWSYEGVNYLDPETADKLIWMAAQGQKPEDLILDPEHAPPAKTQSPKVEAKAPDSLRELLGDLQAVTAFAKNRTVMIGNINVGDLHCHLLDYREALYSDSNPQSPIPNHSPNAGNMITLNKVDAEGVYLALAIAMFAVRATGEGSSAEAKANLARFDELKDRIRPYLPQGAKS